MPRASLSQCFYFHTEGLPHESYTQLSRGRRYRSKSLCRKGTCRPLSEEKLAGILRHQPMAETPSFPGQQQFTHHLQYSAHLSRQGKKPGECLASKPSPIGVREGTHRFGFTAKTAVLPRLSTINTAHDAAFLLRNAALPPPCIPFLTLQPRAGRGWQQTASARLGGLSPPPHHPSAQQQAAGTPSHPPQTSQESQNGTRQVAAQAFVYRSSLTSHG